MLLVFWESKRRVQRKQGLVQKAGILHKGGPYKIRVKKGVLEIDKMIDCSDERIFLAGDGEKKGQRSGRMDLQIAP